VKKFLYAFDKKNFSADVLKVAGIDEAGRGPLAGPVVAAAVILDHKHKIFGLDDSKKLSPLKRENLFKRITSAAKGTKWAVGVVSPSVIDSKGILYATFLAARRALKKLKIKPALVVFDGNIPIPQLKMPQKTLVGADGKSACVAAASIIAKVTRDRIMKQIAIKNPGYGFELHKGYGTQSHYEAIIRNGLTRHHRRSFLKNILHSCGAKQLLLPLK